LKKASTSKRTYHGPPSRGAIVVQTRATRRGDAVRRVLALARDDDEAVEAAVAHEALVGRVLDEDPERERGVLGDDAVEVEEADSLHAQEHKNSLP